MLVVVSASGSEGRPTICLTMIVRDAAPFITETLATAISHIDTWCIVDTGSIDNTCEVVTRFFAEHGIAGVLHERPWRGFGPSRNEALDLARGTADYALMLDADDLIVGSLNTDNLTADGYRVRFGPDNVYWRTSLFRLDRRWEYRGVVHEYAVCLHEGATTENLEGDYHFVFRSLGGRSQDPNRYLTDARALLDDWEREPDPRTAFYIASSMRDGGDDTAALEWFTRRMAMDGWDEETYVAALEHARCMERLEHDPAELVEAYTRAWRLRPHRAEALYELARRHTLVGNWREAYLVICRAAALPVPGDDLLFVAIPLYQWGIPLLRFVCAQRLGLVEEALAIADELLSSPTFPDSERERLLYGRNLLAHSSIDSRVQHRPALVTQVHDSVRAHPGGGQITLTITTLRRRSLFERTIDSFLQCCSDRLLISRWICIDDGSSGDDLAAMQARYPFFEFIIKGTDERGHARSMNRLLEEVTTPYWLHLEDDYDFVSVGHFLREAQEVLDSDPSLMQVVLNRHYAETFDQQLVGGVRRRTPRGFPYLEHQHLPIGSEGFNALVASNPGAGTAAYWPGFSLMPSLIRTSAMRAVGAFHPSVGNFEMEYGFRARAMGWRTAFLDTMTAVTTGPLRGDRSPSRVPNAYELGGAMQYPEFAPASVAVVSAYGRPDEFVTQWRRQFPREGSWGGIRLVDAGTHPTPPDYWLVVNHPGPVQTPADRTLVVQMEPSNGIRTWGAWAQPDDRRFVQVRTHEWFPNTIEWHLAASYDDLWTSSPPKTADLSAVVSSKRMAPGHHFRLDLLHRLEADGVPIDIFGYDNREGFRNYRGALPPKDKRAGLFPYRYTLAVENCVEHNYFTEKVVDALLSECLPFYWGCAELGDHLDPDAYIRLPTDNLDAALLTIRNAIANDEWSRRLPAIRRAKRAILDSLQLAPVLARSIAGHRLMSSLDLRVINLDRRPDRLEQFRLRCAAALPTTLAARVERFAAIDGDDLTRTEHILHTFRGSALPLLRHQTACALSHLALWWEVANGDGSPMLILEDDVEFDRGFTSRLVEVCGHLADPRTSIDVVMLGLARFAETDQPRSHATRLRPLDLHGVMGGTFAYLLTRRGARRLWEIMQRDGISTAIDTFLITRGSDVDVREAVPALATAVAARRNGPTVDSDIQYSRALL